MSEPSPEEIAADLAELMDLVDRSTALTDDEIEAKLEQFLAAHRARNRAPAQRSAHLPDVSTGVKVMWRRYQVRRPWPPCPSCGHDLYSYHGEHGCYYTVLVGMVGREQVCPCGYRPGDGRVSFDVQDPFRQVDAAGAWVPTWVCWKREHRKREHPVAWDANGVAHCTAPGCEHNSEGL